METCKSNNNRNRNRPSCDSYSFESRKNDEPRTGFYFHSSAFRRYSINHDFVDLTVKLNRFALLSDFHNRQLILTTLRRSYCTNPNQTL